MGISVTGRQFEITPEFRSSVEAALRPIAEDPVIKATSVSVVIDREKSRFKTTLVVSCKYHVITSEVEDFDLSKSFDAALRKTDAQLTVLRDKIRSHRAEGVAANECRKAEDAARKEP